MDNRTKVCIITNAKDFKGGISSVVNGYHHSRLEKDFNVHYVESCCDSNKKIIKIGKMLYGYLQYIGQLISFRPEIVHVNSSFGFSFYRKIPYIYLGKFTRAKVINHIHGAEFGVFYGNASEKKKKLISTVYNKADFLIALSDEWKENLALIVPKAKIRTIENYSVIHRERTKSEYDHTILFMGEIGKRKGCCDIPKIAKYVENNVNKCKFILAGNPLSDDYSYIWDSIKELNLQSVFEFPGWVRDKRKDQLLRQADVFFLPSYNEGMPMSILDAMGYALPIVSTNVGGIPKIVRNGFNGFVCAPGDIEALGDGLIFLLTNPEKMKEYGENSLLVVKDGYSIETHIDNLEKLYEEALNRRI